MTTPTPETDAAYKAYLEWEQKQNVLEQSGSRDLVCPKAPNGWEIARKLECERDEARTLYKSAVSAMTAFQSERDQLRKVCDELAYTVEKQDSMLGWKSTVIILHEKLPHVIAAKKGKTE